MAGVDGIETDLRHTRDGTVVLYHDHAIAGVPVSELSHREMIDRAGIAVPTLADWRGDVLVTSFLHDVAIRAARETARPCGALIAHRTAWGSMPLPHHGVDTLVWDWKVIDPESLRQAHIAGWTNAAYGAVSADEHRLADEWGIGTLITDHIHHAS